jgi:hypothetical protein
MNAVVDLVVRITRLWTSIYTLGLVHQSRQGRRAEIDSDLWDQQHLAHLQGEQPLNIARHIFIRCLLGIPADIAWRVETNFAARNEGKDDMREGIGSRIGVIAGIGASLFPMIVGIGVLAGGSGDWSSTAERILWGAAWIIAGALVVAGLLTVRHSYARGMTLIAVGVLTVCLTMFWMAFILAPVGIALLAFAHIRGRAARLPRGSGTA